MAVGPFTGAKGKSLLVVAPAGVGVSHALMVGVGAEAGFDETTAEIAAAEAYQALQTCG